MSDPNYNAVPHGGYRLDADDYARMEVETVRCLCNAVVPKDDARRDDGDTTWLCGDCFEAIEKMKEGVLP
jgi:hypothetical protein